MKKLHPSSLIPHPSQGGVPVADDANPPSPFDVQTIKHLVTLMSRHDLSEIDLRDGQARLRLRRGPRRVVASVTPPPVVTAGPAPSAAAPPTPRAEPSKPAKALLEIKSPAPGIFYAKPKPELPLFVAVGSRVTPTTVVGLVEAMKIYSEITADCSGVIAEIVAEDGKPVEYGQVLYRVDPTG
jgi:acetyl-CoA carboxylase biotin carboxyl carrier protein